MDNSGGFIIKRGDPGIEPGTSCTLNRNHTTRPIALIVLFKHPTFKQQFTIPKERIGRWVWEMIGVKN
jgi:hypothetical protein